ncbi:MAG TPA: methylated-DNA--[protein]-cysteine S-methyltransferase [Planctomycetota bacterium]|nr:methylated-DNA--[protein]-cysteine S-methyltransferase [Planctomycetota bacterium]
MAVAYAVVKTGTGSALVAADRGRVVASFLPGPKPEALVRRLRERFPDAAPADEKSVPGAGEMRRWLEGDPTALASVPVDLGDAPPFAGRVYRELRKVPPGRTLTYKELARRAGSPRAVRAVGRAMATNRLAPFVPCHRVIGSDGKLTGYSAPGGLALKARFLAAEARANP